MSKAWRPKLSAAKRRPRIIEGDARAAVVASTAEILSHATLSAFQFEATCRHAIRSAMVLDGHRWPLADLEAAAIVSAALNAMGARRPTWAVGQPEAVIARENCQRCGRPLDQEDFDAGRRYCDSVCANSARTYAQAWDQYINDSIHHAAAKQIRKEALPARPCIVCRRPFRALKITTRTCSPECAARSREDSRPDRTCRSCGQRFHPRKDAQWLCSTDCAGEKKRLHEEKRCPNCSKMFYPRNHGQECCSRACYLEHRRTKFYTLTCQAPGCGRHFESLRSDSRFCSRRCENRHYYYRAKSA